MSHTFKFNLSDWTGRTGEVVIDDDLNAFEFRGERFKIVRTLTLDADRAGDAPESKWDAFHFKVFFENDPKHMIAKGCDFRQDRSIEAYADGCLLSRDVLLADFPSREIAQIIASAQVIANVY